MARLASRMNQVVRTVADHADIAVLSMVTDIHAAASRIAPHKTGALVRSGRIERKAKAYYRVTFGDSRVRYARRRHFENKLHPGTLLYLQKPGDQIARNGIGKYWRSTR